MANKRLYNTHRDRMVAYLEKQVKDISLKDLGETRDKLLAQTKDRALAIAQKAYPAKDMAILAKYGCTQKDTGISLVAVSTDDGRQHFDDAPSHEFECPEYRYRRPKVTTDYNDAVFSLHDQYKKARDQFSKEFDALMLNYRTVINETRYFEDVVALIPELESLRHSLFGTTTAVSIVSEQCLEAIRADIKKRAAAK